MIILLPILHPMYAHVGLASTNQSFVLFDWWTQSNYGLTPASIELANLYTASYFVKVRTALNVVI